MGFLGFRTAKPRQFSYKPVFFDQEKEELEKRRKEMGLSDKDISREQLRTKLDIAWRSKEKRKIQRNSTLSILITLFVILLLLYLIFR